MTSEDKDDPNAVKYAKQGYFIADIVYPDNEKGTLIYLKTTFFRELSADLYGYKKDHPEFPDEPTSDQFFNENQFEAYRELGFQTAWQLMKDQAVVARAQEIFIKRGTNIHVVKKGDNLKTISKQFYRNQEKWRLIAKENDIEDPKKLAPGTLLNIPGLEDEEVKKEQGDQDK